MAWKPGAVLAGAAFALAAAGCGGGDHKDGGGGERADRPAKPPGHWHTFRNRTAGFTLSVPDGWREHTSNGTTLIRPRDRVLAISVAADRSATGRQLAPAAYAHQTLNALPQFEGTFSPKVGRVEGSPYSSAVLRGDGDIKGAKGDQRITVAALHRPGHVTYTELVFINPKVPPSVYRAEVARILGSLRGQPPPGG